MPREVSKEKIVDEMRGPCVERMDEGHLPLGI